MKIIFALLVVFFCCSTSFQQEKIKIELPTGFVSGSKVEANDNGSLVLTSSPEIGAKIWDLETKRLILSLDINERYCRNFQFSEDGNEIVASFFDSLMFIDVTTGEKSKSIPFGAEADYCSIETVFPIPNTSRLIVSYVTQEEGSNEYIENVVVYDYVNNQIICSIEGFTKENREYSYLPYYHISGSKSDFLIFKNVDNEVFYVWNLKNGQLVNKLSSSNPVFEEELAVNNQLEFRACLYKKSTNTHIISTSHFVYEFSPNLKKFIKKSKAEFVNDNSYWSNSGNYFFSYDWYQNKAIILKGLDSNEKEIKLFPDEGNVVQIKWTPNDKYFVFLFNKSDGMSDKLNSYVKVFETENLVCLDSISLDSLSNERYEINMTNSGFFASSEGVGNTLYYDFEKKTTQRVFIGRSEKIDGCDLERDKLKVKSSRFWTFDLKKGEPLIEDIDVQLNFVNEENYFIGDSLEGTFSCNAKSVILQNMSFSDEFGEVEFYLFKDDQYVLLTKDGYFKASSDILKHIFYRVNSKTFLFSQFDLKYNRPDIILDRLGYADSSLVDAYHSAYQKRLKKMGFTEDMLEDDFHLPEIKIENYEEMPSINDNGSIQLDLKLEDSKYKLDRINVWVNDVAIYGVNGISLREKNVQNYSTSLTVYLAKGNNKVQVSVLNQAGAESYKETFEIECTAGKNEPNLYLITIGESEFKQEDYNLTFAAKDANDITELLANSKAYNEVFTKTLTNEEVTKENILALKSFLERADINDQVMIFIAGHGVLDANLDYYFATYDMDFQDPKGKGLAYEDLESLLDGIKPLKKTLMIDACHSGEIDKDEVVLAQADLNESDDIQFRAVGNTASPKLGMQNTSELTKSLFTDLRKGTGATVISSAGGMEFAMEGDDWNNGLFTYCFINGIKSKEADLDNNGEIWLSEIQEYVGQQVTELSGGRQQPTSRIENQTVDFRVW